MPFPHPSAYKSASGCKLLTRCPPRISYGLADTTATLGSFYWLGFETSGLSPDKKRLAWLGAQRIVVAPAGSISEFKKDVVAGCHTRLVVHWRSLVKHPGNASGSPGGKGVKTLRVATPGGNVRCQRETPPRRGSAVNLRDPHRGAPIQDACSFGVSRLRSQRPATLTPEHRFKSSAQRQRACLPTAMDPHNQRISPVSHFCTTFEVWHGEI